jgi:hypothetical protein
MSQENVETLRRGYEYFNRSGELIDRASSPL